MLRRAFRAVPDEFVTRDTTNYGAHEKSLDEKVAHVMRQLERGEARIVFEPAGQRAHCRGGTDGHIPGSAL